MNDVQHDTRISDNKNICVQSGDARFWTCNWIFTKSFDFQVDSFIPDLEKFLTTLKIDLLFNKKKWIISNLI